MITLDRVSKSYGSVQALGPTNLSLEAGKTTVLIGPSGCGKSTLLRLMIGLVMPDEGMVSVDSTPLHPDNLLALRHQMGYVIQEGGLFPHLTASDNITLLAQHLRWSRSKQTERLATLADLVKLPLDLLDRYPVQLSGGQRQRVSLMRALMLNPSVLLLDEPLGALDPMIRADLQADLRHIFRSLNKTVVIVTHDLAEAAYFGDLIVLLKDGHIIQQGTLDDFNTSPADPFVTTFLNAQRVVLGHTASEGKP